MRQFLEQLEKAIQSFFENSIRLIPNETANNQMVLDIVNQITNIILGCAKEGRQIPNQFEIFIHPDDLNQEFHSPFWIDEISQAIHEASMDTNFIQIDQVLLQLNPDVQVARGKVIIHEVFSEDIIEKTAVIQLNNHHNTPDFDLTQQAFLILPDNQSFPLTGKIVQIGRKKENDLVVDQPTISRHHAQIRLIQGKYVIFDLGSTGGVYVNGIKIDKAVLNQGDVIGISDYSIIYGEDCSPEYRFNDDQTTELPKFVDKE